MTGLVAAELRFVRTFHEEIKPWPGRSRTSPCQNRHSEVPTATAEADGMIERLHGESRPPERATGRAGQVTVSGSHAARGTGRPEYRSMRLSGWEFALTSVVLDAQSVGHPHRAPGLPGRSILSSRKSRRGVCYSIYSFTEK
jgi:hypothetical protein